MRTPIGCCRKKYTVLQMGEQTLVSCHVNVYKLFDCIHYYNKLEVLVSMISMRRTGRLSKCIFLQRHILVADKEMQNLHNIYILFGNKIAKYLKIGMMK